VPRLDSMRHLDVLAEEKSAMCRVPWAFVGCIEDLQALVRPRASERQHFVHERYQHLARLFLVNHMRRVFEPH
jgi:hypothetical protein